MNAFMLYALHFILDALSTVYSYAMALVRHRVFKRRTTAAVAAMQ